MRKPSARFELHSAGKMRTRKRLRRQSKYDPCSNSCLSKTCAYGSAVTYAYTPDLLDAGYTLTLSNGVVLSRSLVRDDFRRSLVAGIANTGGGATTESLAYAYDALNRPASRNGDMFGYNERGEVVFSRRDAENEEESYSYDDIGNLLRSAFNTATNTYTANNLNQYTSILRNSESPREVLHDLDGNMTQCGDWTYTYDAANRLKTVSSNGVLLVTNFYDAKSRRVKKVTPEATTTFFYDDWNLVEERIAYANSTSSTVHYYWGKDLSGTLQGAGGIGGLLYLTVSNSNSQLQLYIPCYDNIGNINRYLDANGNIVAQYTYDAFGKTISATGSLVHLFCHRFSTKYFDTETGLYYYGRRFYSPGILRWTNRDPAEERKGRNLYAFCNNSPIVTIDPDGREVVVINNIIGYSPPGGWSGSSVVAETVFMKQRQNTKATCTTDGKLRFLVEIVPDVLVVHVYYREMAISDAALANMAMSAARNKEQDHIEIARKIDMAFHRYKSQVENIRASPKEARRQKEMYEELLNSTVQRLYEENSALDRKGGPHDL